MEVFQEPRQFDVVLADNMFGDILTDCAATVVGSMGMLPSAAISETGADSRRRGLYESLHGSTPQIAGKDQANPIGAILSFAMMLDYSLGRRDDAELLRRAVELTISDGKRTADIATAGDEVIQTSKMTSAVMAALDQLSESDS